MATITNIRSPRYSSPDNSTIDVLIDLDGETMPFTATPYDPHDHGVDIYERAVAGEFGEIAPYIAPPPPPEPSKAELIAQLEALRAKIEAL